MKTALKIILLILFGLIVFSPIRGIIKWVYYLLYIALFIVLILFYFVSYYVGKKDFAFSLFVAMVPPMSTEDLIRGRLVIDENNLVLYQKVGYRKIKEVWRSDVADIESFTIGRVVGARRGLLFNFKNGNEARFTLFNAKQKKEAITKALNWQ
jgi:hypothetical protein